MVRQQPLAGLIDVGAEALRWESEGLSGAACGCSDLSPFACGIIWGSRVCLSWGLRPPRF